MSPTFRKYYVTDHLTMFLSQKFWSKTTKHERRCGSRTAVRAWGADPNVRKLVQQSGEWGGSFCDIKKGFLESLGIELLHVDFSFVRVVKKVKYDLIYGLRSIPCSSHRAERDLKQGNASQAIN